MFMPIRRIRPAAEIAAASIPAPSADQPGNYEVGYGKPPRHSRFKPGQSGNPRGRPKGARGLKAIVHDLMTAKIAVRTATGERKISRIEAVLQKTIELAMKGNQRALAELTKLYSAAVPDLPAQTAAPSSEELSPTDLAILEELKAGWLAEAAGERP
jgi:hypothetical protein